MKKLGALWLREGKSKETGEPMKFFSGELEDMRGAIPIVIFKNNKKEKENHPDYIVYLSEPREEDPPKGTGHPPEGGEDII